ncbi:hypothetical protein SDC9_147073 [bioreactor metagenome]|uniref:Mannose-6-phosphate isomerase cupin domain-containing protein n=1 Tax=bioreactor metagenome TaxID=1076179 RepID=A0A645EFI9_9ZZZZ
MFDCFHYDQMTLPEAIANYKLTPLLDEETADYKMTTCISYDRIPYFSLRRIDVTGKYIRDFAETPSSISVISGEGTIKYDHSEIKIECGDCVFIPKETIAFSIEGKVSVLECLPPKL